MNITVFLGYYEPETASSMYLAKNLLEGLASRGHRVDLFVPLPTRGVSDNVRALYRTKRVEHKCNGRLVIHRYSLQKETSNILQRFIRYALLVFKEQHVCKIENTDLVFLESTPPIHGLTARALKKRLGVPVIYGLQDIFPDSLVSANLISDHGAIWRVGRLIESMTYKYSDHVVVISRDMAENLVEKGVPRRKISVIQNWVETEVVRPVERRSNPIVSELSLDPGKFYVVYAGNCGFAQDVGVLLEASKLTASDSSIQYLIFGQGSEYENLKERIEKESLRNVRISPLLPYERSGEVYSLADLALVSCKPGFGSGAMPSKTWNILASGTRLLVSFDSGTELERVVKTNGLGLFVPSGSPRLLAEAIMGERSRIRQCGETDDKCCRYVSEERGKDAMIKQYEDIFEKYALGGE